ncbi:hypothetical protein [Bacillus sp. B15-48]|uniref:hypothetical protein n=1 Tax=Bacillus sp. B15-48 TaxID=1548601 RepID=UPI00193EDB21|nr:hypothetical protein [Bacillus sp. B15-48]MBM4762912.1 hypothetical protein [Bacillus sp. B15-48]
MNNLPTSILTEILSEKIKRASSVEYNQFVTSLNVIANNCDSVKELQQAIAPLEKFLPHLDLFLSVTDDYEDIMNMKATLLDLFVNDLNYKSIYLLSFALSNNHSLKHLQTFVSPIQYWVAVIKAKELLESA